MGQCVSFLSNGVWSTDPEQMAHEREAKLTDMRTCLSSAAKNVKDKRDELKQMYDDDGIPLPEHQYEVGAKIIEYRAAVREHYVYSATYSDWLDLISSVKMSQVISSDTELKEKMESRLKQVKDDIERRRNRNSKNGNESKSATTEAKQATANAINDMQNDQESDPLLSAVEPSDLEMSFGAQMRKWKLEDKRQVSSSASSSLQQEESKRHRIKPVYSSQNGDSKQRRVKASTNQNVVVPLDFEQ